MRFFSSMLHVLGDSTPRFVGPSVGPSIGLSICWSHFTFYGFLRSLASLLLPKWSSDLKYSPCPPALNWGSRVSGLVSSLIKNLWVYLKSFKPGNRVTKFETYRIQSTFKLFWRFGVLPPILSIIFSFRTVSNEITLSFFSSFEFGQSS